MAFGSLFTVDPLAPAGGDRSSKPAPAFGSGYSRAFADDRRSRRRSKSPFAFGPDDDAWSDFDYRAVQETEPEVVHPHAPADRLRFDWQRRQHRTPENGRLATPIGARQTNDRTDVAKLEAALHDVGAFDAFKTAGPTGYFGFLTDEAIRDFQDVMGLKVDGVVEPAGETWRTLTGLRQAIEQQPGLLPGSYRTMELKPEDMGKDRIRTMEHDPDRDGPPQYRKMDAKTEEPEEGEASTGEGRAGAAPTGRMWRNVVKASATGAGEPPVGERPQEENAASSRPISDAAISTGGERPPGRASTRLTDRIVDGLAERYGHKWTKQAWDRFRSGSRRTERGQQEVFELPATEILKDADARDAEQANRQRFEADLRGTAPRASGTPTLAEEIATLQDGETKVLEDNWHEKFTPEVLTDMWGTLGTASIESRGEFNVTRDGNDITLNGFTRGEFYDTYDFSILHDQYGATGWMAQTVGDGVPYEVRSTPIRRRVTGRGKIVDGKLVWQRLEFGDPEAGK